MSIEKNPKIYKWEGKKGKDTKNYYPGNNIS